MQILIMFAVVRTIISSKTFHDFDTQTHTQFFFFKWYKSIIQILLSFPGIHLICECVCVASAVNEIHQARLSFIRKLLLVAYDVIPKRNNDNDEKIMNSFS